MIGDKEIYRKKCSEIRFRQGDLMEQSEMVDRLLSVYGDIGLEELSRRLHVDVECVTEEYEDATREEREAFENVVGKYGAARVEAWLAAGYDMVDLADSYMRGTLPED